MKNSYLLSIGIIIIGIGCGRNDNESDAFGNFQATEILVSAETSGRILEMNLSEGDNLKQGQIAVIIDSIQYQLKINELDARRKAVLARKPNIEAQVSVYNTQKDVLQKDRERIENMLKEGAATQKQLDDILGQIEIINRQIGAIRSNMLSIESEVSAIEAGIAQAKDMLSRTRIYSPIDGIVLQKYANSGEITSSGRALFKIADISSLELKAFVSGSKLTQIKLGQEVKILVDSSGNNLKELSGKISWISTEAEFTPKNIQTREERLSQVYAIKIRVKNDGTLKINMPGEVKF